MTLEWSAAAIADLQRFAEFLNETNPELSKTVATAIVECSQTLEQYPELGRAIDGRDHYRQAVMQVLNTRYIFQYLWTGERLVMLRVFHGRETR